MCTTRSASATSSSVDRNASTRSCGSFPTNPTVSEIAARRLPGQLQPARRGIERREQLVGHEDVGPGERVHQRGLAGVRVAGDRDLRDARALAALPLHARASCASVLDVAAELRDPPADVLAVDLHLRLAGAAGPDAAAEPAHRLAPSAETGQEVVELRELDLRLALAAAGVQREDVEDQRRPVDHLDARAAPRALRSCPGESSWSKITSGRVVACTRRCSSSSLPRPIERGGIGLAAALDDSGDGSAPAESASAASSSRSSSPIPGPTPTSTARSRTRGRHVADSGDSRIRAGAAVAFPARAAFVRHQLIAEPCSRSRSLRRTLSSVPAPVPDDQAAREPVAPRAGTPADGCRGRRSRARAPRHGARPARRP